MRPACPLLLAASLLASCEGLVEPVAASTSPADDTAEVGQRLSATAALDATLKVPRCAGSASGCSAGTLLNGWPVTR